MDGSAGKSSFSSWNRRIETPKNGICGVLLLGGLMLLVGFGDSGAEGVTTHVRTIHMHTHTHYFIYLYVYINMPI